MFIIVVYPINIHYLQYSENYNENLGNHSQSVKQIWPLNNRAGYSV